MWWWRRRERISLTNHVKGRSVTNIKGGKEGCLERSFLAQELPSISRYRRKNRREGKTRKKT